MTDRAATAGAGTTYVVGAGISGLACAVRLARTGRRVAVFEGANHGGGRCRSFLDAELGRVIDNGNHLLLTGNDAALAYLDEIGARDSLVSPPRAVFPFVDLGTGERWTIRPNRGRIPWWILSPSRRIPGTRPHEYLGALRLRFAPAEATVADCFEPGPLFERFWRPLAVAALNMPPEEGAARLLWPVVALTFGRGEAACRPCVARNGLSASFVDPAVALLRSLGCEIGFNRALKDIAGSGDRVTRLAFADGEVALGPDDQVVLALPPAGVARLVAEVRGPEASRAIVNLHFRLDGPPPPLPGESPLVGIIGGIAEWVFVRGDVASVTVSAAEGLVQTEASDIAARVWPEVVRALDLPRSRPADPLPPHRVVKERRATFAQTPASLARRPKTRTRYANLFLAGDWTDTGLPATIEGAVRSGHAAARAAAGR